MRIIDNYNKIIHVIFVIIVVHMITLFFLYYFHNKEVNEAYNLGHQKGWDEGRESYFKWLANNPECSFVVAAMKNGNTILLERYRKENCTEVQYNSPLFNINDYYWEDK